MADDNTSPFIFAKDLSQKKDYIFNEETEAYYKPHLMNKFFSYFFDTVFLANEMNKAFHMEKLQQYKFYFHAVKPKNRFSPWSKREEVSDAQRAVAVYFDYNLSRAKESLAALQPEEVVLIMAHVEKLKEM